MTLERRITRLERATPARPQASFVDLLIAMQSPLPNAAPAQLADHAARAAAAHKRLSEADPDSPLFKLFAAIAQRRAAECSA